MRLQVSVMLIQMVNVGLVQIVDSPIAWLLLLSALRVISLCSYFKLRGTYSHHIVVHSAWGVNFEFAPINFEVRKQ